MRKKSERKKKRKRERKGKTTRTKYSYILKKYRVTMKILNTKYGIVNFKNVRKM